MAIRKKVLLVQNTINDYRVETYNIINESFDLTVGYNVADQTVKHCEFKKIKFNTRKIGPFDIFGKKFWKECEKYDAVITSFNIHNFEFLIIPFIRRKFKLLTWSIGFRCSYTRPYDVRRRHQLLDKVSYAILKAADANIFYMEKACEFWKGTNLDQSKIFIAPNTTSVKTVSNNTTKQSILFVGSLYRGKGVDKLILAYKEVAKLSNITLDIVGKGEMLEELKSLVKRLQLENKVIFHGPIYEEDILSSLFENAIICVSPNQAGLTIPKSMGYGVPVVTRRDAITGGEIYHITNNVNGIIYDDDLQLVEILSMAINNSDEFTKMGVLAKKYYYDKAQPKHQAQGVNAALTYALKL